MTRFRNSWTSCRRTTWRAILLISRVNYVQTSKSNNSKTLSMETHSYNELINEPSQLVTSKTGIHFSSYFMMIRNITLCGYRCWWSVKIKGGISDRFFVLISKVIAIFFNSISKKEEQFLKQMMFINNARYSFPRNLTIILYSSYFCFNLSLTIV